MPAFPRCPNCFNIYDGAGCEKKSCNYVPWAGPTVAQADKSDVIRAIQANGAALEYASDAMKADREVVMLAVKKHGLALQYASSALRADRDVVLEAVKSFGPAFEFAADTLKKDRRVVRDALRINPGILTYADKRLLPRLRNPKNVDEDLRPIRGYGLFMASDGPDPIEWGDPVIDHYHNRPAESVGFTSSQLCNALARDCDTRGCGACLRCTRRIALQEKKRTIERRGKRCYLLEAESAFLEKLEKEPNAIPNYPAQTDSRCFKVIGNVP
jgi:hypothetical protein